MRIMAICDEANEACVMECVAIELIRMIHELKEVE